MVFAIEPVLYSTQQNFAVFLEDVILVTDTGYDVLSRGMPYTVQEVEDVMRQTSIIDADNRRQRQGSAQRLFGSLRPSRLFS